MKSKRSRRSAAFKAKVAIEAIRGEATINEIAGKFGVHPNQVSQWKRQALEGLPQLLSNGRSRREKSDEELKDHLYRQIGELKVELDWLKKKTGYSD